MTVEEKREVVDYYCCTVKFENCVLNNKEWEHTCSNCCGTGKCLLHEMATEAELDRALALIDEAHNVEPVTGAPEPCVLEQGADDTGTIIKIDSNRKIKRVTIEFTEEVQA